MALVVSLELEEEESLHNAGQISFVMFPSLTMSSVTPTVAQPSERPQASSLGQVISQTLGVGEHPLPGTYSLGGHSPSAELVAKARARKEILRKVPLEAMLTSNNTENTIVSKNTIEEVLRNGDIDERKFVQRCEML